MACQASHNKSRVGILPINLPPSVAWHLESNIMPSVRDQGKAIICWAFGSVAGLEAYTNLAYGGSCVLSRQELLNCIDSNPKNLPDKFVDTEKFYATGISQAFNWVQCNGLQLEKDFPWKGTLGPCIPKIMKWNGIKLVHHKKISTDEWNLLSALERGPVVGGIAFTRDIKNLGEGIWDGHSCIPLEGDKYPYHVGVFTGYDTDKNGENFYWFQSSWGKGWGNDGYGKILRESSYSSCEKRIPPSDCELIKFTRIPTKIYKIVKGNVQDVQYTNVGEKEKKWFMGCHLKRVIDDYEYNTRTNIELDSVGVISRQVGCTRYIVTFKIKVKDFKGNTSTRKCEAQLFIKKDGKHVTEKLREDGVEVF